ncbi:MAG: hypothetical protein H6729_15655 [Deltaproteobacteria bacterium]|nr:hypothetical protein [Deltaproteobacteria bacterium]
MGASKSCLVGGDASPSFLSPARLLLLALLFSGCGSSTADVLVDLVVEGQGTPCAEHLSGQGLLLDSGDDKDAERALFVEISCAGTPETWMVLYLSQTPFASTLRYAEVRDGQTVFRGEPDALQLYLPRIDDVSAVVGRFAFSVSDSSATAAGTRVVTEGRVRILGATDPTPTPTQTPIPTVPPPTVPTDPSSGGVSQVVVVETGGGCDSPPEPDPQPPLDDTSGGCDEGSGSSENSADTGGCDGDPVDDSTEDPGCDGDTQTDTMDTGCDGDDAGADPSCNATAMKPLHVHRLHGWRGFWPVATPRALRATWIRLWPILLVGFANRVLRRRSCRNVTP